MDLVREMRSFPENSAATSLGTTTRPIRRSSNTLPISGCLLRPDCQWDSLKKNQEIFLFRIQDAKDSTLTALLNFSLPPHSLSLPPLPNSIILLILSTKIKNSAPTVSRRMARQPSPTRKHVLLYPRRMLRLLLHLPIHVQKSKSTQLQNRSCTPLGRMHLGSMASGRGNTKGMFQFQLLSRRVARAVGGAIV